MKGDIIMKKRVIAAVAASALIASAAMTAAVSASADTEITESGKGEWTIGKEGLAMITEDILTDGVLYDLHIELNEEYYDSMTLFLQFHTDEKTYELMYIMMMAEPDMYIPVDEIVNALFDRYPDEDIPFEKITSVTVSDAVGLVKNISFFYEPVEDTDAEFTYFSETEKGRRFELGSAAAMLMDAGGTAGGGVGIKISFEDALDSGFDVRFVFGSDSGEKKTVKAYSTKSLSKSGIIVNVCGLVAESGMNIDDITSFTVVNKGDKDIGSIDFGMGSDEYTEIRFRDSSVDGASEDANPATGVGFASSALIAAVSGTAALLTRKRR